MSAAHLDAELSLRRGDFGLSLAFTADAGTTVALIGPNGAGKSTTLAALAGLLPLTEGHLRVGARTLEAPADATREPPQARDVGMCFQGQALFGHLSAVDNVAYGLRARGVARTQARAMAHSWLERLEVGGLAARRPAQLSGGQAQRVALARALITAPSLLLLDEPFAGLDARTHAEIRELLRRTLAEFEGVALLTSHDFRDVEALADEVLVLEHGALAQRGSPAAVAAEPATEHLRAMVDAR